LARDQAGVRSSLSVEGDAQHPGGGERGREGERQSGEGDRDRRVPLRAGEERRVRKEAEGSHAVVRERDELVRGGDVIVWAHRTRE